MIGEQAAQADYVIGTSGTFEGPCEIHIIFVPDPSTVDPRTGILKNWNPFLNYESVEQDVIERSKHVYGYCRKMRWVLNVPGIFRVSMRCNAYDRLVFEKPL